MQMTLIGSASAPVDGSFGALLCLDCSRQRSGAILAITKNDALLTLRRYLSNANARDLSFRGNVRMLDVASSIRAFSRIPRRSLNSERHRRA